MEGNRVTSHEVELNGNSGHHAGPKKGWREGVFEDEEIRAAYSSNPQCRVQGASALAAFPAPSP